MVEGKFGRGNLGEENLREENMVEGIFNEGNFGNSRKIWFMNNIIEFAVPLHINIIQNL